VTRLVHVTRPTRELQSVLMKAKAASDDRIMVQHLADLLEKIFTLDPAKRISVKEALHHPFVSSSAAAAALS
jgi:serine/threonine-protein kinase PRP4